jgi:hypothetical protein
MGILQPARRRQEAEGLTRRIGVIRTQAAGFSLLEVTLVVTVLLFAMLAMSRSLGESMQLTEVNRESALAMDAAREMIEVLEGVPEFSDIFLLYNSDPTDDPGVLGSAPGSGFAVAGLQAPADDPDGLAGEVLFPTVLNGFGQPRLSEQVDDPGLGMPRDLDGDGESISPDVSDTYRLLPVRILIRWRCSTGERVHEVRTLIADL